MVTKLPGVYSGIYVVTNLPWYLIVERVRLKFKTNLRHSIIHVVRLSNLTTLSNFIFMTDKALHTAWNLFKGEVSNSIWALSRRRADKNMQKLFYGNRFTADGIFYEERLK